jgi:twitching motility protein PilT
MARIDGFIQTIRERGAERLIIASGARVLLASGGETRAVSAQPATIQQVQALLSEIAPAFALAPLTADGTIEFIYEAPSGRARVQVTRESGRLKLDVSPFEREAGPRRAVPPAGVSGSQPAARPPDPGPATGSAAPGDAETRMRALFLRMVRERCSDLHLSTGNPPLFRKDGDIVPLGETAPLRAEEARELLYAITPPDSRAEFEERRDADFSYEIPGVARFRCNLFLDRNGLGGVFRVIPTEIPSAQALGLPGQVLDLCALHKGLVLVTGPTGSGKSTTLASMIDHINRTRSAHVITIEDPIEFVHQNRRCLINQREVGAHTAGFRQALRAALREDPDIVLVGEMRDLETIAIAIETAETGHLVFGTLHTNTAPSTVDRIIDQFPADRQSQVRTLLSESLRGVIAQTLCRRKGGGRVAALEILLVTPAISNLIREGKTFQIPSIMQTAKGAGMVMLNDALLDLVGRGLVDPEEACSKAVAKAEMRALLARAGHALEAA